MLAQTFSHRSDNSAISLCSATNFWQAFVSDGAELAMNLKSYSRTLYTDMHRNLEYW